MKTSLTYCSLAVGHADLTLHGLPVSIHCRLLQKERLDPFCNPPIKALVKAVNIMYMYVI